MLPIVVAVALTACGGSASEPSAVATGGADAVTLVATEFAYDPSTVTVPAGTSAEIVLDNQGSVEHDLTIEEGEIDVVRAAAGSSASGTVTLDAGTYTFYCTIPGHRAAGMEGTLTAK